MTEKLKEYVTMTTFLAIIVPGITLSLAFTYAALLSLGDQLDRQVLEIRELRERVQALELAEKGAPMEFYIKRRSSPR